MRPEKWIVWEPFLLALMVTAGIIIGMRLDNQMAPSKLLARANSKTSPLAPVKDAIKYIESRYIEAIDAQTVNDTLLKSLVSQLDPHTYYLSGWHYHSFKHQMSGSYNGIGIDYEVLDDSLTILHALRGGPAHKAGLRTGDIIMSIDSIQVTGSNLSSGEVYRIWQSRDRELSLQVKRASKETFEVSIEKATIEIPHIPAAFMIDSVTGFIKIASFTNSTYREFMKELDALVNGGCKNLIIDVRDNPGGSFESVVDILNQLVPERDRLMVYMEGQHVRRTEFRSKGNAYFTFDHIIVLINQNSISGSEILAGVMQDLDRGIVIGRRSYGKALVQETFPLTDTTALNLTIGKYFLPSGRFIQRPFSDRKSYALEWESRGASGEFFFPDSLPYGFSDTSNPSDHGRSLPSGVGIIPDIFIPADSLHFSLQWKTAKQIVWKYALKQYGKNLQSIPDNLEELMAYKERSGISEALFEHLKDHPSMEASFVEKNQADLNHLFWSEWIEFKLGNNEYYRFFSAVDPDIQAALRYIRKSNSEKLTEDQL